MAFGELKRVDIEASTAKDSDHRLVPLNKDALDVLTRWRRQCEPIKQDAYVFLGRDGKPLRLIDTEWCQIRDAAGLEGLRLHDLRDTFASKLVQKNVDLLVVRDLLGHADMQMTTRYAHLADTEGAEAVARIESKS